MVVYLVSGLLKRDTKLWNHAFIGIVALLLTWIIWIGIVDWFAGQAGSYWNTRLLARQYVAGNPWGFFRQLAISFLYSSNIREQIRYSIALIIPLINLWIIGFIPLSHERHRYAIAAGNLAMIAIALNYGNPNKIIVYTTTLPSHFAVHILFMKELLVKIYTSNHKSYILLSVLYFFYCINMLVVYILGTPLGWYY
jgi:hypothetical protein